VANEPVVQLDGVTFGYDGDTVFEDVSFTIHDRDSVSIVGPNGGGKTTLLKLILGIVRPESGSVRVFGRAPERVRHRMGYMPQRVQYDAQFPVTVTDVVLMGRLGRRLGSRYSKEDREVARGALAEVELAELAGRSFANLSGGQRQRVLIARALACEPDILLLDEPLANVDMRAEEHVFEIFRQLNKRMTILMVTHDLGFVAGFVRTVACVNRRVVVHPTSEITGEIIQDLYGGDLRIVHHGHLAEDSHSNG